jgi:hypothetical protein
MKTTITQKEFNKLVTERAREEYALCKVPGITLKSVKMSLADSMRDEYKIVG